MTWGDLELLDAIASVAWVAKDIAWELMMPHVMAVAAAVALVFVGAVVLLSEASARPNVIALQAGEMLWLLANVNIAIADLWFGGHVSGLERRYQSAFLLTGRALCVCSIIVVMRGIVLSRFGAEGRVPTDLFIAFLWVFKDFFWSFEQFYVALSFASVTIVMLLVGIPRSFRRESLSSFFWVLGNTVWLVLELLSSRGTEVPELRYVSVAFFLVAIGLILLTTAFKRRVPADRQDDSTHILSTLIASDPPPRREAKDETTSLL